MKRILFLSISDITKRSGAGLASLAYYNALNELYPNQVDLLIPEEYAKGMDNVIPVPKRSKVKALLSGSPHRYKAFIVNFLRNNHSRYSACVLNGGLYAGNLMDDFHKYGIKIMVIHHNFEREYHMDNKSILTLKGLTPWLINRIEKSAYVKADVNCFLTKNDSLIFKKTYGSISTPSHVIGVFEPHRNNIPIVTGTKGGPCVAITGSMDSVQTMTGIRDLRENYIDIFMRVCPGWSIIIGGRNPKEETYKLQEIAPERIEIIPNPVNMEDITNRASFFLCPTNVGGGLKLRVMDGLRQGLPVITHVVSCRGYEMFLDKPYFRCYDGRESFEKGLIELIDYCKKGYERKNIQEDYLSYCGFENGLKRIELALNDVLNKNL